MWRRDRLLVSRSVSGVDLVVPTATDTPFCESLAVHNFTRNLIGRRSLPASWFEVKNTDFTSRPVLDLHGPIVVHGRVTGNNANN